jgi:hypothetical protein
MEQSDPKNIVLSVEDVKEPLVLPNQNTIVQLIQIFLIENNETPTIDISPKTKKLINEIIEIQPGIFKDFSEIFQCIIADNKIDTKDIPNFISIIKLLYQFVRAEKKIKISKNELAESIGQIIKLLLKVLLENNAIKTDDEKKQELILALDAIIDTCITLINLSDSFNFNCFSCFQKK